MGEQEPRYAMDRVARAAVHRRREKLEQINDAATLRSLDALAISPGWRCVEVCAGAGSIAWALSERNTPWRMFASSRSRVAPIPKLPFRHSSIASRIQHLTTSTHCE